ncbi:MAG: DUF4838 domain-containing protein [Bacteroidaceae bacterium]|nr:DUF4838 domain-containing protein [Bacteroidaceae bacterium]
MKNIFVCIVIALVAAVAGVLVMMNRRPVLFQDGKSDYVIVLCNDASVSEQTSAKELQAYLGKIAGVTLPIVGENQMEEGQKHIFIGFNKKYSEKFSVGCPDSNDEGYTYRSVGKNIWIYGGKQRGTMYGVFSFLENEFGVRWYSADCIKVPTLDKWDFGKLMHCEKPFVRYRYNAYAKANSHSEWMAYNKCNMVWGVQENEYGGLTGYWGCHTFSHFIPTGEYFEEHPEYFSMRDGKRTPYTQLCLSNAEVLQICTEKMKQVIADNPQYWVYDLSQNDNHFPCQCDECKAIEEKYGGHSGLMVWFVNQVADAIKPIYPDKYIGTFAYQYTRQAPTDIAPRDNVLIRLCSIECCFAHPLEECEHNKSFMIDMENWSKIAPQLFVWDYVVNFRQYVAPFPNFGVLAKNIKVFKKYNAMGIHELGVYNSLGSEFHDLRAWVIGKLLWNPDLDAMALAAEFIAAYYGEAAPFVQQYFELCHSIIKDDTVLGIYDDETNPLFTDEFITQGKAILDLAKEAVASAGEDVRLRVDEVCLQMDYMRMMRYPQEAMADGTYERVCAFARQHNIRLNEWTSIEEFIGFYNKLINGEITIEQIMEFITKRWIEQAG